MFLHQFLKRAQRIADTQEVPEGYVGRAVLLAQGFPHSVTNKVSGATQIKGEHGFTSAYPHAAVEALMQDADAVAQRDERLGLAAAEHAVVEQAAHLYKSRAVPLRDYYEIIHVTDGIRTAVYRSLRLHDPLDSTSEITVRETDEADGVWLRMPLPASDAQTATIRTRDGKVHVGSSVEAICERLRVRRWSNGEFVRDVLTKTGKYRTAFEAVEVDGPLTDALHSPSYHWTPDAN